MKTVSTRAKSYVMEVKFQKFLTITMAGSNQLQTPAQNNEKSCCYEVLSVDSKDELSPCLITHAMVYGGADL